MTEAEWLAPVTLRSMLKHLEGGANDRKLRLWAVAYCRHIWGRMGDQRSRTAVEVAERFADGQADEKELAKASRAAYQVPIRVVDGGARTDAWNASRLHIRQGVLLIASAAAVQRELLRDIFGNPFRPPAFSSQWRTITTVALAKLMYDSRDFSLMPILADALMDAGCEDADILSHCRSGEVHVRGCWVVDLVLGKQ